MVHTNNVPGRFWVEAMMTATHMINKLPQPKRQFVVFIRYDDQKKGQMCCDPTSRR